MKEKGKRISYWFESETGDEYHEANLKAQKSEKNEEKKLRFKKDGTFDRRFKINTEIEKNSNLEKFDANNLKNSSNDQTALLKTQQKSDSEKSDDDDDEVNNPKNHSGSSDNTYSFNSHKTTLNSQHHEFPKVEKSFNFNNFGEQKAPRVNKNSDTKSSQNFNLSSQKTVAKHAEKNNKIFMQPNFKFDFGKNKSSNDQTALLKTQQKSDSFF
ncbi:unnamed protein product [Brachionus calyciflorus]|uniref:Uncharacterized protein n=1 Tax=Brachionus calyciflorus TaxID=104777 RepID=A0A814KQB7_9BILA|nr:unnamed protein product [Brachionus calyciflorus]